MNGEWSAILMIVVLGIGTYAMRIGGHLVLSRFEPLNPRLEAALDAVPAAVMTAIVAPIVLTTGIAEAIAAGATIFAALRLPIHGALLIGVGVVAGLRAAGL